MTDKKQIERQNIKAPYRDLVNPKQLQTFLDGNGSLANRDAVAEQFDYDWHARKLRFDTHFIGHVLMQATAYESARDHQWAAQNDVLFVANGAAVEISVSGLAQANKTRPIEPYFVMMQQVMTEVSQLPYRRLRELDKTTWHGITDLLKRTDIFDASILPLPPKLADWAPAQKAEQAALKLQLKIGGEQGELKQIMLTQASGNDNAYFDPLLGDLDAQTGMIFAFDGGYLDFDTYQQIVQSDNHFVTQLADHITVTVVETLPRPDEPLDSGYTVLADELVYLGDDHETVYRRLRVQLTNGEEVVLLTSLLDLTADQICLLYRYRWTIEIVFRWLKQLLSLDHIMSHDPNGVLRQILTALIVWALLVIANQDTEKLSPKQLWRQLQADLHQAILEFGVRIGLALSTRP